MLRFFFNNVATEATNGCFCSAAFLESARCQKPFHANKEKWSLIWLTSTEASLKQEDVASNKERQSLSIHNALSLCKTPISTWKMETT